LLLRPRLLFKLADALLRLAAFLVDGYLLSIAMPSAMVVQPSR
jgi:hypothetical protein